MFSMDTWYFVQIVAAVIVGNAASFAFFMGAMEMSRQTKAGADDDQMPWWVYACMIVPCIIGATGAYLLT
jgi:hypothetical protein